MLLLDLLIAVREGTVLDFHHPASANQTVCFLETVATIFSLYVVSSQHDVTDIVMHTKLNYMERTKVLNVMVSVLQRIIQ